MINRACVYPAVGRGGCESPPMWVELPSAGAHTACTTSPEDDGAGARTACTIGAGDDPESALAKLTRRARAGHELDRFAFGAIAQEPSLRGKHEGG